MNFDQFYKENREKIFLYALKKTNSKEQAEDFSSETFFKVYRSWSSLELKENGEKRAWTYTVCRNLIIDSYRKKKETALEYEPESDYESTMSELIKEESKMEIHTAISKLPADKQELLELRFGQDLKIKEIAEILDLKEGACKMKLYRALEELKTLLNETTKH